jgi:hypothetical protein
MSTRSGELNLTGGLLVVRSYPGGKVTIIVAPAGISNGGEKTNV